MDPISISLISALIGSLIVSISAIVTMLFQSKTQKKIEFIKSATQLTIEDYKIRIEKAKTEGGFTSPVYIYFKFNYQIIDLISKGKLNEKSYKKIDKEMKECIIRSELPLKNN
jgi:hypothetical protein